MRIVARYLIALLLPLMLVACGGSDKGGAEGERPKMKISRERAEAFARSIETAMNEGNTSLIERAFDLDAIFDRVAEGVSTTDADRESFISGTPAGFGFAEKLKRELGDEGAFRLVHFRWDDGRSSGLYRITHGSGSLNYVELIFGDREDTIATTDDVFMYNTGELFTSSLRRLVGTDQSNPLHTVMARNVG